MKKGILVAILALLTGVTLVGCGQKSDEQVNNDSENTTVATENEDTKENNDAEDVKEEKDEESPTEEEKKEEPQGEPMELGEQAVQGEAIQGTIYNGNYRLTNGSDRIVVEWAEAMFKSKTEYVFEGDKLSAVNVELTYSDEEQAKADYETANKQNEEVKKAKDLRLDGATIKYTLEDSAWVDIKDYSKQEIFDNQKKLYDELSKVDDIRSDD